jgi:hypothetical protein
VESFNLVVIAGQMCGHQSLANDKLRVNEMMRTGVSLVCRNETRTRAMKFIIADHHAA